jgi:hypothetical protein
MTVEDYTPPDDLEPKESIGDDDPDDALDEPNEDVEAEPLYTEEQISTFTTDYPGAGEVGVI